MKKTAENDWVLGEDGFTLYTPQRYRSWYNYICNDDYGLKISHLADGYATTLKEPRIAVSNYDFFSPVKGRYVYVKDSGSVWNPSFMPSCTELDSYALTHESGLTSWKSCKNNLECSFSLFVPPSGTYEIWLVSFTNTSKSSKKFSFYPQMEFLLYNSFSVDPVYYSWYTNTRVDEKGAIFFERRTGGLVTGFFAPFEKPVSYECSLTSFFDGSDFRLPGAIQKESLSNTMSAGDPYIAACQYSVELSASETKTFAFFAGIGSDTLDSIRKRYTSVQDVINEKNAVRQNWKQKLSKNFPSIQNKEFLSYLKTFFGYQIYQQSAGMVRGTFRGFRDVAQDALAFVHYDKEKTASILTDMCTRQYKSGRCLRQWNTEGGSNDERDFRDLSLWTLPALYNYEKVTGDASMYTKKAVYLDSDEAVTLWEHAIQGLLYALQFGSHGLLEMGKGDWNDALSGPGEKGGSVFLNQIAYLALSQAEDIALKHGFSIPLFNGLSLSETKEKLYRGCMKYWNGSWFARCVSDKGLILGTRKNFKTEDGFVSDGTERLFLLSQAWFVISGMSKRSTEDGRIGNTALSSMLSHLECSEGLLKMAPGYSEFEESAGNISGLAPGMAENYAIYNHAASFAVYALFKAGRNEEALRIMSKILPFTKDWKKTKAEPYVLVNFYNGGFYEEKKGTGGISWLTGTVNWLSMSLYDFILPQNLDLPF